MKGYLVPGRLVLTQPKLVLISLEGILPSRTCCTTPAMKACSSCRRVLNSELSCCSNSANCSAVKLVPESSSAEIDLGVTIRPKRIDEAKSAAIKTLEKDELDMFVDQLGYLFTDTGFRADFRGVSLVEYRNRRQVIFSAREVS